MLTEGKLVINELEQGKESANKLMDILKSSSSSSYEDSNETLISKIQSSFENAIVLLNLDKETRKRSHKKRKISEKKIIEKVMVCDETKLGTSLDDGYSWRKYGQKEIHGSKNPRGYFRCTHRFTQGCLAMKQVQKSDIDPLCYEIKYLENHTCNITQSTTKYSKRNRGSKEKASQMKSEELMLSVEDLGIEKEIFRTFSFSNIEIENDSEWKNLMEYVSPTTSESGVTNELLSTSVSVANSPKDDDLCFSSLDNILVLSHDLSWM